MLYKIDNTNFAKIKLTYKILVTKKDTKIKKNEINFHAQR